MNNYEFIKSFQDIKISNICKKFKINLGNLLSGGTTEENYKKVKDEIIRELLIIFIQDKKDELAILYLYDEILKKLEKENKMLREMI